MKKYIANVGKPLFGELSDSSDDTIIFVDGLQFYI